MPLSTSGSGFSGNPSLFNSGNDYSRVPSNQVLAPYSARHEGTSCKKVSRVEMDALLAANKAINETWRVLSSGSGNQQKHLISTEGDVFKRTMLAQNDGGFSPDRAYNAARFQAGNCGEMAAVCALLGASSGIHQPVSVLHSTGIDHALAEFGDSRVTSRTVIADPWPEFGRALRRRDCSLLDPEPVKLFTLQPAPAPHVLQRLLYENKASQEEVDRSFAKLQPDYPKNGKKLLHTIMREQRVYSQVHGAEHLGRYYSGEDSKGTEHVVDLNFAEYEFKHRLVQLGLDPLNGKPTPGNRRPKTSWIGKLSQTIRLGRPRLQSTSALPPADIVTPWTHDARGPAVDGYWGAAPPPIPVTTMTDTVSPRHRSTFESELLGDLSSHRRMPDVVVPSRAIVDPHASRDNTPSEVSRSRRPTREAHDSHTRRQTSSDGAYHVTRSSSRAPSEVARTAPRSTVVGRSSDHRHASRDDHHHPLDTAARRNRASSFANNQYRFPIH